MISKAELLLGKDYKINDFITIHNPTWGEIQAYGKEEYMRLISKLIATPIDYKELLEAEGIGYKEMPCFIFFGIMSRFLSLDETRILFGDLDFSTLSMWKYKETKENVFYNPDNGVLIDVEAYLLMIDALKKMHGVDIRNYTTRYNDPTLSEIFNEIDASFLKISTLSEFIRNGILAIDNWII